MLSVKRLSFRGSAKIVEQADVLSSYVKQLASKQYVPF